MQDIELTAMSDDELSALKDQIEREQTSRDLKHKALTMERIKEMASAAGLSVTVKEKSPRKSARSRRGKFLSNTAN